MLFFHRWSNSTRHRMMSFFFSMPKLSTKNSSPFALVLFFSGFCVGRHENERILFDLNQTCSISNKFFFHFDQCYIVARGNFGQLAAINSRPGGKHVVVMLCFDLICKHPRTSSNLPVGSSTRRGQISKNVLIIMFYALQNAVNGVSQEILRTSLRRDLTMAPLSCFPVVQNP